MNEEDFNFTIGWTTALLNGMKEHPNNTYNSFENCACFHYDMNNMDLIIQNFKGNLNGFLVFLCDTWGWKVTLCNNEKKIIIDENKDYCVCPVVHEMSENVPENICNCSEHFAKKIFSQVTGSPVNVKVIRSILRDGKSCMYEITF